LANINDEPKVSNGPAGKPVKSVWLFAGLSLIVLIAVALLITRQRAASAASVVEKAASSLDKISSYHLKYKMTLPEPNGSDNVAYYEYWYQSPAEWKLVLTQPGSTMTQLLSDGVSWQYTEGSGTALETPVSDEERERNIGSPLPTRSPKDMLKSLEKGFRYVGPGKVGGRDCEVIEGDFPQGRQVKVCLDRDTGITLQAVETRHGKVCSKEEIVTFDVDKLISKDTFTLKLPAKTLVIKAPEFTLGLIGLDSKVVNAIPGDGSIEHPYQESSLKQLADQGITQGALLKRVYEPGYLPLGYRIVAANSIDQQRRVMPDGSISYAPVAAYSTLVATYVNPATGNAMLLYESADKLGSDKGEDVTRDGFHGRISTYQKPFPYVTLSWQSDDVHFKLSATDLSEQEAVKIAKSMLLLSQAPRASASGRESYPRITADKLEFRYLRSIKSESHPSAKYDMILTPNNAGEVTYKFTDSKGRTVDSKQVIAESPLILSGADLEPVAKCMTDSYDHRPIISIQFNPKGTKKSADFTKTHQGEYLAIVLDGRILSAPRIAMPITNGQAVISGGFKSLDEAQNLADVLNRK